MYDQTNSQGTRAVTLAERAATIASLLTDADRLIARAAELVAQGGVEAMTGLTPEMVCATDANRTSAEARALVQSAHALQDMPVLREAFGRGAVSWSQVRAVVAILARTPRADRTEIDGRISQRLERLSGSCGDALVAFVEAERDRRRPDLLIRREDRAESTNFFYMQQRFDGGMDFFGSADAERAPTIVAALDLLADRPEYEGDPGDDEITAYYCRRRAGQHLDALSRMAEQVVSGASGGHARPRPRLYASFDVAGLTDPERAQGIELFSMLVGRNPRLSRVARDTLVCDSTIVPVVYDGSRVIEIGDAANTFSDKVRRAIIARDRRCRFCGSAPAAWSDCHHLVWGKGNTADDGCLLCRRCHRRVHRYGWSIRWVGDGFLEFSRRGQTFLSAPP